MNNFAKKINNFMKESSNDNENIILSIENYRENSNKVLRNVIDNGNLDMLIFLKDVIKLNIEDIRSNNNYCLRKSAEHGHHEILLYLKNEYKMTYNDVIDDEHYSLIKACKNGHLSVIECLFEVYGMNGTDLVNNSHNAIKTIIMNDHRNIIQYLKDGGYLTSDMIVVSDIINDICTDTTLSKIKSLGGSRKNLEMIKYLVKEFSFSQNDLSKYYSSIIQLLSEKNDLEFLQWFHQKYSS